MDTRFLAMESIMDTIETRLKQGDTPKRLILDGFKRSTVYKVSKRLETKGGLNIDDRTLYLARLIREAFIDLAVDIHDTRRDSFTYDPDKAWKELLKTANESFTGDTGKSPPKDLML